MKIIVTATALLGLALAPTEARAQCREPRGGRVAIIAGTFAIAEVTAIAIRHSDWWTPPARSFHTIWHGSPSKGQDGLLHAAIAYQASQAGALAWDWACVPRSTSGWLGAALGIAIGLPKEMGDGFHQNGFSGPDMMWTTAGALLPALHRQWPQTRLVQLKVFYWPSAEYRNRTGRLPELENDYAGQRYWMSFNPARAGVESWPAWLGIALGHGVPHWLTTPPEHDWYVALALDLRGLPITAGWWRKVATLLDQGKLPMPGIRIRGGSVELGVF